MDRRGAEMLCAMPRDHPPRWRVFLSHTSELREYPAGRSFIDAAETAVIKAGHQVSDMAYFAARDQKPTHMCRDAVWAADVYVLVAGFRYGSLVSDRPNASYTELEFDAATEAKMPRLVFLLGEDAEGPPALFRDVEYGIRQDAFRVRVRNSGLTAVAVAGPAELEAALLHALMELSRDRTATHGTTPGPVWSVPSLRGDEVARPGLAARLVSAVLSPGAAAVGVTTGLVGAGGFGKTTLARMTAYDPRIRGEFHGGVVWVTVGEHAIGPDLAGKIVSTARLFDPAAPDVTDPMAAGAVLGRVVEGRRVLLVVDDVWSTAQVEPFLTGAEDRVVRLFTTRQHGVLPIAAIRVRVDQMVEGEAHELLTAGLPGLSARLVADALQVTGRWPVLLSLVHGAVRDAVREGGNAAGELREVVGALRDEGLTALDATDQRDRSTAVAATIEVSLGRLTADEQDRYRELAVFGKDTAVPGDVVARLWAHTGGWTRFKARSFCGRLFDLGLLAGYRRDPDRLVLHDVIRAYLRQTSRRSWAECDAAVVDAHRNLLAVSTGGSN